MTSVKTLHPSDAMDPAELPSFYQDCLARGERPAPPPAFMWQDRLDHALNIALISEYDFETVSSYYSEMGKFRKAARSGAVALSMLLHQPRQVSFPALDENALVNEGVLQTSSGSSQAFLTTRRQDFLCPYIFQHRLVESEFAYIAETGIAYVPLAHDVDVEGLARALTDFQARVISRSLESVFMPHFCTIVSYGPLHVFAAPLVLRTPSDVIQRLTHKGMDGEHFAGWLIENRRLADYMDELGLLENIPDTDYVSHSRTISVYPEPTQKRTLSELETLKLVQRFERLDETEIDDSLTRLDRSSVAVLLKAANLPCIRSEIFGFIICDVIVTRCFQHILTEQFGDCVKLASGVLDCFFDDKPTSLYIQIYDECVRDLIRVLGDFTEYLTCIRSVTQLRTRLLQRLNIFPDIFDPLVDEIIKSYNISVERLIFLPVIHNCHPILPSDEESIHLDVSDQLQLVMHLSRNIANYTIHSISLDEPRAQATSKKIAALYSNLAVLQNKAEHVDYFLSIGAHLGDSETRAYCAWSEEICQTQISNAIQKLDTSSSREILVASEGCRALYERFKNYETLLPIMKELVLKTEEMLGQVHGVYHGLLIRLGQTYVRSGADLQLRDAAKIFSKAVGIASQLVELNVADDEEKLKYTQVADFCKMFFAETQAHMFKFDVALKVLDQVSTKSIPGLLQRSLILRDRIATLAGTLKYAEALNAGAQWRCSLTDLQQRLQMLKSTNWRVFVAAERLRCEVWMMDKATIGDFWDALLLSENPQGILASVAERPLLVKQVLDKYLKEPSEYNENKSERRVFLWEEGSRKLQVLDAGLKEAAELMLLQEASETSAVRETNALEFMKSLLSGDLAQRSIAVHVFACCSWMMPRLFGCSPADKRVPALGPILAVDELKILGQSPSLVFKFTIGNE
jgi:hypothetical protein